MVFASFSLYYLLKTCTFVQGLSGAPCGDSWPNYVSSHLRTLRGRIRCRFG